MRASLAATTCLMLVALLAACGSSETAGPAKLVPRDSAVYGELTIDPEGDEEEAVRDIAGRFPGGEDINEQIDRSLGEALREENVDYDKEVKPYLGEEAVFFISGVREDSADGAAIIEVTDEEKARAALEKLAAGSGSEEKPRKRSYEGNDYVLDGDAAAGVVDQHAVIGTEEGFKAAVKTSKESADTIEDSERVRESLDRLPDDALASVYVDGKKLVSGLGAQGALLAPFLKVFDEPYVFGVSAESDAVVVDSTLPRALTAFAAPLFGSGTEAVGELPGDAWYGVGQPEVGKTFQSLVDLFAGAAGGQEQVEARCAAPPGST